MASGRRKTRTSGGNRNEVAMTSLAACLVTEENEIKWQVGVVEREQVASG